MFKKNCLFTNDVETTSILHNSLRDDTGFRVYKEGMPALLDLYAKYNIKTTFFFTGYIARKFSEVVKIVLPYGHEVASHGLVHDPNQAFDVLPYKEQLKHLKESKMILEDISGQEVTSFRAPSLRVNKETPMALTEAGYKIDSSISSQRFDFFLTFGNIKKLKWITAPRTPYYTSSNNLFKKGKGSILEIPISAMVFPYIGTTMRIFPNLTRIIRLLLHEESRLNNKPIVFLFHPNEFIDESDEPYFKNRRGDKFISYFFGDLIRRKLKIKNLGKNALKLYEDQIKYFKNKHYKFSTLKDYSTHFNEKHFR